MSDQKREKLSDTIRSSNYVFTQKVDTFKEAYPTIASLTVEVTERSVGIGGVKRKSLMTEQNFRHAVDCSNPRCYSGGVEVGWLVHEMARLRQADREETRCCQGYEGSPKGTRRYRSCATAFVIKAHIEYKTEP